MVRAAYRSSKLQQRLERYAEQCVIIQTLARIDCVRLYLLCFAWTLCRESRYAHETAKETTVRDDG